MKLLIVESPAKAKTIEKYLGKDYKVLSSVGHVRDLPKSNKKAIDIEGGFVPHYENLEKKAKVISDLKSAAKKADEVLLATDPDREGEAIAWHVAEALKLPKNKRKRVAFNEITEEAVTEAVKHPREIDMDLKEAQEARRVLDRLVGYDLSGLIWKKVRYGLSAGRVQSPALRIIMEREREIRAFKPETFWVLEADLESLDHARDGSAEPEEFTVTCIEEPRDKKEVERILDESKKGSWSVIDVKESEAKRSPRAPFTTSTLQQAASSQMGFAPSKTMGVAQKLYEAGHITYMRTDSTTLSKSALAGTYSMIEKEFGKEYLSPRTYKTKSKNAQEAHEAVRPTTMTKKSVGMTAEQKSLYGLIWRRTVASQMADAKLMRMKLVINIEGLSASRRIPDFTVNGSRVLFDGWLKADPGARGEDVALPKVKKGDALKLEDVRDEEKETQPLPRYSEAGLVKELEKRGIGRPSTYAATIKNLVDRGYVDKEQRSLIPTDTGDVVSSFLEENFGKYIGDDFTAEMEDKLDDIAAGKGEYKKTLEEFYGPFLKDVKAKESIEKITNLGVADAKHKCPICKKGMVIKLGKNGKFLSCETFPECSGARTIDGEKLQPPREIGEDCPKCTKGRLIEREGRFGLFVGCNTYPKCKFIKQSEEQLEKQKTGVDCPECKKGEMIERSGRFGIFYSCQNYPDCKYAIKAKPTGAKCPMCQALMMEGTKTIPERCSDKTCPNHNPHKLDAAKK